MQAHRTKGSRGTAKSLCSSSARRAALLWEAEPNSTHTPCCTLCIALQLHSSLCVSLRCCCHCLVYSCSRMSDHGRCTVGAVAVCMHSDCSRAIARRIRGTNCSLMLCCSLPCYCCSVCSTARSDRADSRERRKRRSASIHMAARTAVSHCATVTGHAMPTARCCSACWLSQAAAPRL